MIVLTEAALPQPFRKETGHCWTAAAPEGFPGGDDIGDNDRSLLRLFEDGQELGPAHAHHADIRGLGGGRFSHWGTTLFFSTSDNSDPRTNGRSYTVALPAGPAVMGRDPATIPEAVAYEVRLAHTYVDVMRSRGIDPSGAAILEIGPGKNLGAAVLLACEGARVAVADRFLAPWVDGYHHQFFAALAAAWDGATGAIDRLREAGRFEAIMARLAQPAEHLDGVPDASIDVVLSASVLEHVYDLPKTMSELRRVTRPGGWQFHGVDLKDHQGYGRHLDHLLMARPEYDALNAGIQNQRGCQARATEFDAAISNANFRIVAATRYAITDEAYFQEILAALRASSSPYSTWPEDDLRVLEVSYQLQAV